MPLYKFYRIVPKDTTQTDCYIGHTIQPLRKRFTAHCGKNNDASSKVLFERYGKDGLEIVLIHELELPDKEYARREERRLWEEVKERAVNQVRPWVSEEERKESGAILKKQWSETNKEHRTQYIREYHKTNKEHVAAYRKQYYEDRKEHLKQYQKAYREAKKTTPPPDASSDTPQIQPLE
jgi:hypothetical protein